MWPQSLILTAIFWTLSFLTTLYSLNYKFPLSTITSYNSSLLQRVFIRIGQATLNAISLSLSSPMCTHLLLTQLAFLVYHYIPDVHAILTPLPLLLDFRTLQSNPTLANSHSIQPWIYPCAVEHGWGERKKDNDQKRSALSLWPLNSKGSQG